MSLFENFTEDLLEQAAIEILQELDYSYAFGPDIAYDGDAPERNNYKDVLLEQRVKYALFSINRHLPEEALEEAYRKIITFNSPVLVDNNKLLEIKQKYHAKNIDMVVKILVQNYEEYDC